MQSSRASGLEQQRHRAPSYVWHGFLFLRLGGTSKKGTTRKHHLAVLLKPLPGKFSSPLKSFSVKPEAHFQSVGSGKKEGILRLSPKVS